MFKSLFLKKKDKKKNAAVIPSKPSITVSLEEEANFMPESTSLMDDILGSFDSFNGSYTPFTNRTVESDLSLDTRQSSLMSAKIPSTSSSSRSSIPALSRDSSISSIEDANTVNSIRHLLYQSTVNNPQLTRVRLMMPLRYSV
jgi:hypothetical protein